MSLPGANGEKDPRDSTLDLAQRLNESPPPLSIAER